MAAKKYPILVQKQGTKNRGSKTGDQNVPGRGQNMSEPNAKPKRRQRERDANKMIPFSSSISLLPMLI